MVSIYLTYPKALTSNFLGEQGSTEESLLNNLNFLQFSNKYIWVYKGNHRVTT